MSLSKISTYREAVTFLQGLVFPYPVTFEVYICIEFILKSREHLPQDSIIYFSQLLQNHIEVSLSLEIAKSLSNIAENFTKHHSDSDNPLIEVLPSVD